MAYTTNNDKMLEAVLSDASLMRYGNYSPADIQSIYQAVYSDNIVVSAVARIIQKASEGASEKEIYKEVTEHLKKNV